MSQFILQISGLLLFMVSHYVGFDYREPSWVSPLNTKVLLSSYHFSAVILTSFPFPIVLNNWLGCLLPLDHSSTILSYVQFYIRDPNTVLCILGWLLEGRGPSNYHRSGKETCTFWKAVRGAIVRFVCFYFDSLTFILYFDKESGPSQLEIFYLRSPLWSIK